VLHNSDVTMDAKSNRVAVPRPVYNAGRFLARALDAIVAQTLSDLELTVIDDGPS
jgi:glycosyltransferase involved in cell wall biosynthesis